MASNYAIIPEAMDRRDSADKEDLFHAESLLPPKHGVAAKKEPRSAKHDRGADEALVRLEAQTTQTTAEAAQQPAPPPATQAGRAPERSGGDT